MTQTQINNLIGILIAMMVIFAIGFGAGVFIGSLA